MCGIVGYTGKKKAAPILMSGLKKLEYRGYDSAGIAVFDGEKIRVYKSSGKLSVLSDMIHGGEDVEGFTGIGHTRWATHGKPNDVNSHPHMSTGGQFAVVHNGIIENYMPLKAQLEKKGFTFLSDTDTEIAANLVEYYYNGDLLETAAKVMSALEGSFALGILSLANPGEIIAMKKESPMIVGLSEEGNFVASDVPAVLAHTRRVMYIDDGEIISVRADSVSVYNRFLEPVKKEIKTVDWDVEAAEKGGYPHFMFKEIMEQPTAIKRTVLPRIQNGEIVFEGMKLTKEQIASFDRVFVVACGSAYHVGMLAKYMIEKYVRVPVETIVASEFRYCDPIVDERSLMIVISQSGETADTKAALAEGKRRGAYTVAVVNVVCSAIANMADDVIYTWAGPEIAVATTKAYSTQLAIIYLFTLYMAAARGMITEHAFGEMLAAVSALPEKAEACLDNKEMLQYYASLFYNCQSIFFIGRNLDYGVALEGSLKLKEISYIHSEAYAAGELKHGTISLIEPGTLVVALATHRALREKLISNIKEVKARGAVVLAIACAGDEEIASVADQVIFLPEAPDFILPSLAVLPLQLFAYYVAAQKGCSIDQPRNLAKSVTVE